MAASSTPNSRLYRTFMYLPTDRVPDREFGCWPQTVRRWVAEGFPRDWAAEVGEDMFHPRFSQFIGTDPYGDEAFDLRTSAQINPPFDETVLQEDDKTQIVRDRIGIIARRWKSGGSDASIPEYLEFPVKDRASWQAMKERYRLDDPIRTIAPEKIAQLRAAATAGKYINAGFCGFYGQLRHWVGVENLSYLIYDDKPLVREMADHWAQLLADQLRQVPADVPIHLVSWWEDMCYNHGPLMSPRDFDEIIVPCYELVMSEARKHGCQLATVDCDGNIHALAASWMKVGVNIMFPCEVAANTDMFALRRQFGREVRLMGGIDKKAIAAGRSAIDRELDRIAPLLQQGGFVPFLDHLVPPDIGLDDYMYYRRQKKELIGKR